MKVWTQWWGGCNYAHPMRNDYEEFRSLKNAIANFQSRFTDTYYPCVSEVDATMLVWKYDPTNERDPYPDLEITLGPRGGIRRERC